MKKTSYIVALFKNGIIKDAYECITRQEVDELIDNTLEGKDNYMYYDDEIIKAFQLEGEIQDELYHFSFYTKPGWYDSSNNELIWENGKEEAMVIDIYKIELYSKEEFEYHYPLADIDVFIDNRFVI